MKYLFIFFLSLICFRAANLEIAFSPDFKRHDKTEAQLNYEKLVWAIIMQESAFDTFAIGSCGDLGLFQITDIRRIDYNQRTGKNYVQQDMFNPEIAREIFDYYAYKTGIENHEMIAKKWNTWHGRGDKAELYWKLVKRYLI